MGIEEKLPRLNFCCACVDLRTGAIILGLLQFFSAIYAWSCFFEPDTIEIIQINITKNNNVSESKF